MRERSHLRTGVSVAAAALATIAFSCPSVAQEGQKEEPTQTVRQRVVERTRWIPKSGVALTTTAYAKEYIKRYKVSANLDHSEHEPVLFQTEKLDLMVFASGSDLDSFWVMERNSGKRLFFIAKGCADDARRIEFVDVESDGQLELLVVQAGSCSSDLTAESIEVFSLDSWRPLLRQSARFDRGGMCPVLGSMLKNHWTPKQRRLAGNLEIGFVKTSHLSLRGPGYCKQSAQTSKTIRCSWQPQPREFECSETVDEPQALSLSNIKVADDWKDNAKNIRWVIANSERLEAAGFRFPDGMLDQLHTHLP